MTSYRCNLTLVSILAAIACTESPVPAKVAPPVRVARAEVPQDATGARYTANVEPRVRVDLAFKVGGYIESILKVRGADGKVRPVQEGDRVKAGDVLCRVQTDNYRVKLQQALGGLGQAEAALGAATQDYERASKLAAENAIPGSLLDGATAKLTGTKAAVNYANGLVNEARVYLADTALKAPLDATVMKRLVEVGSLVGPGIGGFVLADTTSMRVVVGVPDRDLDRFAPGAQVPVRIDVLGLDLTGRVTRVAPFADPRTRVFEVEVTIPNDGDRIRAGMFASVTGAGAARSTHPAVPLSAIIRPPGRTQGYAVVVVDAPSGTAVARVREVEPGDVRGGRIEIVKGIQAGEFVAISGASFLADGQTVTVVP